jgi:hypothetical protein
MRKNRRKGHGGRDEGRNRTPDGDVCSMQVLNRIKRWYHRRIDVSLCCLYDRRIADRPLEISLFLSREEEYMSAGPLEGDSVGLAI